MHDLEKALRISMVAHNGQTDRAGLPYILHPIAVASRVKTPEEKTVALLHDVVEDSPLFSIEDIYKEFPAVIGNAVEAITKTEDVEYLEYIKGVKDNPLARAVKIADIKENLDLTRLGEISEDDINRLNKYLAAYEYLSH